MFIRLWLLLVAVGIHARLKMINDIETDEPKKLKNFSVPYIDKPVAIDTKSIKWSEVLSSTENGLVVSEKHFTKKSWCRSQVVRLQLSEPGCIPRIVITRLCYGQCNSFFIPRPNGIFESCPSCRASKGTWLTPTVSCGSRKVHHIKIYRVKKCKCLPTK